MVCLLCQLIHHLSENIHVEITLKTLTMIMLEK